jgi:hypothetical protein
MTRVRCWPLACSEREVKEAFSKYGDVRDVYIPRDYHTK